MKDSFFSNLFENDGFTSALGRAIMSSAKLEGGIKKYIEDKGIAKTKPKDTLGQLINSLINNHSIDKTSEHHFRFLLQQRNYFTHNLFSNLSEYPKDEREVYMFISRVNGISEEMEFFSGILLKEISSEDA